MIVSPGALTRYVLLPCRFMCLRHIGTLLSGSLLSTGRTGNWSDRRCVFDGEGSGSSRTLLPPIT